VASDGLSYVRVDEGRGAGSSLARRLRAVSVRSAVAGPVVVDGGLWALAASR
jgi:hypothetical protein